MFGTPTLYQGKWVLIVKKTILYTIPYIQHCEEKIVKGYKSMTGLGSEEARSERLALMTEDKVTLSVIDSYGWDVRFDKTPTTVSG